MAKLSISRLPSADARTEAQKLRPTPGNGGHARYIKSILFPKVKALVDKIQSYHGRPPAHAVDKQVRFVREQYLPYLEFDMAKEMTEKSAKYGRIKEALLLLSGPHNRLPKDIAKKADELYKRFDGMAWDATRRITSFTGGYPPDDHPIWGTEGIMHGVIIRRGVGGRPIYELDDRFTPRNAKVYGHNGLQPGSWFPRRECFRFHGGHAQSLRGISGHEDQGASIVVSGKYNDIDEDEGDTIFYGAEGAHDKDSSKKADVKGNRALRASISTQNPVRVFRSAKGGGRFAPPCGIRYDGLYRVVSMENRRNEIGGVYQRYTLHRLRDIDQPPLDDIVHASPTPQQQADFSRITAGY